MIKTFQKLISFIILFVFVMQISPDLLKAENYPHFFSVNKNLSLTTSFNDKKIIAKEYSFINKRNINISSGFNLDSEIEISTNKMARNLDGFNINKIKEILLLRWL